MPDLDTALERGGKEAYRLLAEICSLGMRYPGTPGELGARGLITRFLEQLDPEDLRIEEFGYLRYWPLEWSLEIVGIAPEALACEAIQYTGNGEAEAEAVHAGKGTPEEIEQIGARLAGRIALVETNSPFMVYPALQARGAVGVICTTDAPENLIRVGTATFNREPGSIPAVAVSQATGQRLVDALAIHPVRLRLRTLGEYADRQSWNVVATWRGRRRAGEKLLVGSHYDSQLKGPHAWDNGTGTAALLALARAVEPMRAERSVEAVFFGVEELGPCWGSYAFVKKHEAELADYKAMLNLDGFCSGLSPLIFLELAPPIRDYALDVLRQARVKVDYAGPPRPYSDHLPFGEKGVPAVWLHTGPLDPYYHTAGDVIDHIDPDKLASLFTLAGNFLARLASDSY